MFSRFSKFSNIRCASLILFHIQTDNGQGSKNSVVSSTHLDTLPVVQNFRPANRTLRKNKSDVWGYFSAKYISVEGWPVTKCKLCNKEFSACNTTNLKGHLTSVHRNDYVTDRIRDEKASSFLRTYSFLICDFFGLFICWF